MAEIMVAVEATRKAVKVGKIVHGLYKAHKGANGAEDTEMSGDNGWQTPPEMMPQPPKKGRGKKVVAAVAGVALIGAGYEGINELNKIEHFFGSFGSIVPHISETVDPPLYQTELDKVVIRGDALLLSGTGKSSASVSSHASGCVFGACVSIPGTTQNSGANVDETLDIIAKDGAVKLSATADAKGTEHIVATVDTTMLTDQRSNERITLTGRDGIFPNIVNVVHDTDKNARSTSVSAMAEDNFQYNCIPALVPDIPAAEALFVRHEVTSSADLLNKIDPRGARLLREMAGRPIHLQFVKPKPSAHMGAKGAGAGTEVSIPTQPLGHGGEAGLGNPDYTYLTLDQVELPTPPKVNKEDINSSSFGKKITIHEDASGGKCLETPAAAKSIAEATHPKPGSPQSYVIDALPAAARQ